MPCNSSYMDPNTIELSLSRVACLLDELEGKKWTSSDWNGFHALAYNRGLTQEQGDEMVRQLCTALKKRDVTKYSLEMQTWWRDHQAADKQRIKQERKEAKEAAEKEAALTKLTPRERKLLGV